jgi:transcriptional regulator with XRE-family HTH domain
MRIFMAKEKGEYDFFLKRLGESLQDIRKEHGLTQAELGGKSNRGQSAIGKIERQPAPNLPLRVIYEIAATIPVPLSSLFHQAERKFEADLASKLSKDKQDLWPLMVKRVEGLPPKKREQIAKIIECSLMS